MASSISTASIPTYLNGITIIYFEAGLANPLDQWGVKFFLKGVNEVLGKPLKRKLSITVKDMYANLEMSDSKNVAFWAAVIICSLLHLSSEVYLGSSLSYLATCLHVADAAISGRGVLLSILHTNTIQTHYRIFTKCQQFRKQAWLGS